MPLPSEEPKLKELSWEEKRREDLSNISHLMRLYQVEIDNNTRLANIRSERYCSQLMVNLEKVVFITEEQNTLHSGSQHSMYLHCRKQKNSPRSLSSHPSPLHHTTIVHAPTCSRTSAALTCPAKTSSTHSSTSTKCRFRGAKTDWIQERVIDLKTLEQQIE
jgi:hypothetical protein